MTLECLTLEIIFISLEDSSLGWHTLTVLTHGFVSCLTVCKTRMPFSVKPGRSWTESGRKLAKLQRSSEERTCISFIELSHQASVQLLSFLTTD